MRDQADQALVAGEEGRVGRSGGRFSMDTDGKDGGHDSRSAPLIGSVELSANRSSFRCPTSASGGVGMAGSVPRPSAGRAA